MFLNLKTLQSKLQKEGKIYIKFSTSNYRCQSNVVKQLVLTEEFFKATLDEDKTSLKFAHELFGVSHNKPQ